MVIATDVASAIVKVTRRISSRSNSRGSHNISRRNNSISRGTSESSPRISSDTRSISNFSRGISDRARTGAAASAAAAVHTALRRDGIHHALVVSAVGSVSSCPSAAQYPLHKTRVFRTRKGARKLPPIRLLKTTPVLGADFLHHQSHPPCRRTCMDHPFRPSHPGAPPPTGPPWRNLRHQASPMYRAYVW